jgi:hypothetical protein
MEHTPVSTRPRPTSAHTPRRRISWSDHQPLTWVVLDFGNLAGLTVRRGDVIRYRIIGNRQWHDAEVIEVEPKYVVVKNRSGASWRIEKRLLADEQLYQVAEVRELERIRLVERGDHWATEAA